VAPEPITIDISTKIEVDVQRDIEVLQPKILNAIADYFHLKRIAWSELNKSTGRGYALTIYRSQILSAIMKVDGVVNAKIPTLNGIDDDIALKFDNDVSQLPIVGTVVLNG